MTFRRVGAPRVRERARGAGLTAVRALALGAAERLPQNNEFDSTERIR